MFTTEEAAAVLGNDLFGEREGEQQPTSVLTHCSAYWEVTVWYSVIDNSSFRPSIDRDRQFANQN